MIKNIFKYKINHKGSTAIEAVLLTPLVFITFIIILYFFFMILTYVSYNNLANSIAQELNMRQTGYGDPETIKWPMPQIMTYKNDVNFYGGTSTRKFLKKEQINFDPFTDYLKGASYKALDKYKDQFTIPFSEVVQINIITTNPIIPDLGEKLSGTIIIVNIQYNSFFTKIFDTSEINAYGYSILI